MMALVLKDGKPALVRVPEQLLLECSIPVRERLTKGKECIWRTQVLAAYQRPVGMFTALRRRHYS